jgi:ligand-binding SRPBCC domain-containing protein
MRRFHLHRTQRLRRPLDEVFPFFADPRNLEAITPPFLRFRVLGASTDEIEEGTEIDYALRLRGVPIRWRSRIVEWDPPHGFVDEQVQGPYKLWHHRHGFRQVGDLTVATDDVTYAVVGGSWVDRFLVRPDLERIFDYRRQQLARLLVEPSATLAS